jgi:hypothetical protein
VPHTLTAPDALGVLAHAGIRLEIAIAAAVLDAVFRNLLRELLAMRASLFPAATRRGFPAES